MLRVGVYLSLLSFFALACGDGTLRIPTEDELVEAHTVLDDYIAERFDTDDASTSELVGWLDGRGITAEYIEPILRAGRQSYPEPEVSPGQTEQLDIDCYHVDYSSSYFLRMPENYDKSTRHPLVIVGHGGNANMTVASATQVARGYLNFMAPAFENEFDAITVAPVSTRGWGHIGNSLILSIIYELQSKYNIDEDRIYIIGHSMGGHLSWRAALTLGDHFAGVGPQSGGYDYVEANTIANVLSVPGYVTYGEFDDFGIEVDNRINDAWLTEHGYDWTVVEKAGQGHEIFVDELVFMAEFFAERPRNMYPTEVYLRHGGDMQFIRPWDVQGWPVHTFDLSRPMFWNKRHWIRVQPTGEAITIHAQNVGDNRIEIVASGARELQVFLHPNMVDFDRPVEIIVNGDKLFDRVPRAGLAPVLELVREFDDRQRWYHTVIDLEVTTDVDVAQPNLSDSAT